MTSHNNDLWFILAAITAIGVGSAVISHADEKSRESKVSEVKMLQ